MLGSIIVLTEAVPRLFQPEQPNATGMFFFALVGVVVNGVAAWRLHGRESLNTKIASWHLVEDVLGWIAVLIVSVTLMFVDFPVLDPILSVSITSYILFNVVRHLRQTLLLFLQAASLTTSTWESSSGVWARWSTCCRSTTPTSGQWMVPTTS